jgi:hypothetical protein
VGVPKHASELIGDSFVKLVRFQILVQFLFPDLGRPLIADAPSDPDRTHAHFDRLNRHACDRSAQHELREVCLLDRLAEYSEKLVHGRAVTDPIQHSCKPAGFKSA